MAAFTAFFAPTGPPDLVKAKKARETGSVTGDGILVAVLDTGCRADHRAFWTAVDDNTSRVLAGQDFTGGGSTQDTVGHGTAVAALIASRATAPVIAPGAKILPLKVFKDGSDPSDLSFTLAALKWLADERKKGNGPAKDVSVVCLSLGDDDNYPSFDKVPDDGGQIRQHIAEQIRILRESGVPTVAAAGNGYFHDEVTAGPGMCFPAIMPECISVGAVFTAFEPAQVFSQYGNAKITGSKPGQLAPFSQRLPGSSGHFTHLFAPGVSIRSAGCSSETAQTEKSHGTSLAAPFVAGVIALMQEWHKKKIGQLPSCKDLESWLLQGADEIIDDAGDLDNVDNTNEKFKNLNALGALQAMISALSTG